MAAGVYDFTIDKGEKFTRTLTWRDENDNAINLTGWTARMQIRRTHYDDPPLVELTTANGRIALGGTAGTITLTIAADLTTAITVSSGVYDLELVNPSSEPTRLLKGTITFTPEVTR
jgi:hypothetical protein